MEDGTGKWNSGGDMRLPKRYKKESGLVVVEGRAKRRRLWAKNAAKKCRTSAVP